MSLNEIVTLYLLLATLGLLSYVYLGRSVVKLVGLFLSLGNKKKKKKSTLVQHSRSALLVAFDCLLRVSDA